MEHSERLTMTVPEAAHALGISPATAYSLVEQGKLPAIRISERRLIIPVKSLLAMLEKAGRSNPPEPPTGGAAA